MEVRWTDLASHTKPDDLWLALEVEEGTWQAFDVTSWAATHPGGALVLQQYAGRDATEPFLAMHPPHVRHMLSRYCVGTLEAPPRPPSPGRLAYRRLHRQLSASGLLRPSLLPYLCDAARMAGALAAACVCALHGWVVPAALCLSVFWQQVAFVGHDAGHHAVSASRALDQALGVLVTASVGINISWWNHTHNVHHVTPNSVDGDPDIQFMPLVANCDAYFDSLFSRFHGHELAFDATAKQLVSVQHLTFLPLLCIARYGLYLQGVKQLLGGKVYVNRLAESAAMLFFFLWYGAFVCLLPTWQDRLALVLLSHAAAGILHLQICCSHFSMGTFKGLPAPDQDWMALQLAGTMNWTCPAWLDWYHGGLQYQIEHHLFPRYHSPTFLGAILETLEGLRAVAVKARALPTAGR